MKNKVDTLFANYEKKMIKKEKNKEENLKDNASVNQGNGEKPLETPSPYSSECSSFSSSHSNHSNKKHLLASTLCGFCAWEILQLRLKAMIKVRFMVI